MTSLAVPDGEDPSLSQISRYLPNIVDGLRKARNIFE